MSFLGSLKRLFFTTESVAKSAVEKTVEYTKEKAGDLAEAAKETVSDISDKTSGLRETVIEKANAAMEKVESTAEVVWDKTKEVASDVADKAETAFEQTKEAATTAVDKLEDMADNVWDKTKDKAEEVADASEVAAETIKEDVNVVVETTEDKVNTLLQSTSTSETQNLSAASNLPIIPEAVDTFEEFVESTKTTAQEEISPVAESAQTSFIDKTIDKANDVIIKIGENEMVQKAGHLAEEVGAKVMEKGEVVLEKAGEISEKVGAKVLDASDKAWDKIGDAKDVFAEKAREVADAIGKKFDETVEKAEAFMAEEDAKPKKEFADETLTTGGSLLDTKDDFFSKASQYADGDYDAFSEGKITVSKTPQRGQDDHDGDGDPQIDDAIIIKE
ncbi:MAG TPA: hypothetical protein VK169_19460 [Saprospiraceae bacterium]|nr:hypothetical protein [Saprospiraceae bacterium]